jgi:myo-inositol catabolism protein IolC
MKDSQKNLFVLPFDHRAGFAQKMLGFGEILTLDEKKIVTSYKQIIYEAIFKAIDMGIAKQDSAVLVDEVYGLSILKDAKEKGLITMQTTEKSGQDFFDFEYEDWKDHLLNIKPSYAKALVRYDVSADNKEQLGRLKELSDFCVENKIGLLIEPLMQNKNFEKEIYDNEYRYLDLIKMIIEMQDFDIEADIWKIEGLYKKEQYEEIVKVARNGENRSEVGLIILGRNETKEHVNAWIVAGREVEGVLGFAVGRTIFWEPLMKYKNEEISRSMTIDMIAEDYFSYYKLFKNLK